MIALARVGRTVISHLSWFADLAAFMAWKVIAIALFFVAQIGVASMKISLPNFRFCFPVLLAMALSACVGKPPSTIHVMSSGGFTAAYKVLGPMFEKETGILLVTAYGASGGGAPDSIPERLKRGEYADVVILSQRGLGNITKAGHVEPASHVDLARSGIGMAVLAGAAQPDISTTKAFVTAMRDAASIGYSASASGTYLSKKLFPKLGIWDEIRGKSTRVISERVGAVVARGDVEIGFQQISEILPIAGIDYVGPLPDAIQKITIFSTGLTRGGNKMLGQRLIDYLSATDKIELIDATGLDAVAKDLVENR